MISEQKQQIGMVGLGRMGANMARRLQRDGAQVVVYNRHTKKATDIAIETGAQAAGSLNALVEALSIPRVLWLMLPRVTSMSCCSCYANILQRARTIIWNGPVGVFAIAAFSHGTEAIGRAIAASNAYSLTGGGDRVTAS